MTRLYGKCCVSFLCGHGIVSQNITGRRGKKEEGSKPYLRGWTFSECRASSAESRTFEECAPSLSERRMEYSLSDLPRPWFLSYNSKLHWLNIRKWATATAEGNVRDVRLRPARWCQRDRLRDVSTKINTHAVVQFGYAPVGDGYTREQHQVDERVDMALLREVERQRALLVVPGVLEVADDVPEQGQGREDADFLP